MKYVVTYEDEEIECLDTIDQNEVVNRIVRNIRRDGYTPHVAVRNYEDEFVKEVWAD